MAQITPTAIDQGSPRHGLEQYYTTMEDDSGAGINSKSREAPSSLHRTDGEFVPCSTEVRQLLFQLHGAPKRLHAHLEVSELMEYINGLLPNTEVLATSSESEVLRLPDGGGAFFTLRCYLRHAKRSVRLLEAGLPGVSLKSDSAAEGAMELPPMGLAVRNELAILQRLARRLHKVGKNAVLQG